MLIFETMKRFKIITLCLVVSFFIACGDDDDGSIRVAGGSNNSHITTSLIGEWKLAEVLGDDGMVYGLNQDIPFYDTYTYPGCNVYDYQVNVRKYSYVFETNTVGYISIDLIERNRSYTMINPATCEIVYNSWSNSNETDLSPFTYEIVGSDKIAFRQDSSMYVDTLNFSLIGNFFTIGDEDFSIKFKK